MGIGEQLYLAVTHPRLHRRRIISRGRSTTLHRGALYMIESSRGAEMKFARFRALRETLRARGSLAPVPAPESQASHDSSSEV